MLCPTFWSCTRDSAVIGLSGVVEIPDGLLVIINAQFASVENATSLTNPNQTYLFNPHVANLHYYRSRFGKDTKSRMWRNEYE